jgi:hypothetical protein
MLADAAERGSAPRPGMFQKEIAIKINIQAAKCEVN